MTYVAAENRYESMTYRRAGRSGVNLPLVSLGLWHNFGDDRSLDTQRAILRRAFDLGVCHFDLANNYGPPYGSAEANFGTILRKDFLPYRDELFLSTKAGWDMWPGPYGDLASRKYLTASLDQSLKRMEVDHVDVFYSHRPDPDTPLEETMVRWTQPFAPARRCMPGSRHTLRSALPRRPGSWTTSGLRCSSTSRPTRCSTGGSRVACSTPWNKSAPGASPSRRWPKGC